MVDLGNEWKAVEGSRKPKENKAGLEHVPHDLCVPLP
jgi:hypothetical protein